MFSTHNLKCSTAATVLLALPTLASAQTVAYSTSPVAVSTCSVNASFIPATSFDGRNAVVMSNDVALSFVNHGSVPATAVKFSLNDGRSTQTIVDAGSFAPGARIDHAFAAELGIGVGRNATCNVAEIYFVDGASWHADSHDVATR